MENLYLAIPLASLIGAIIAGFMGKQIGRVGAHTVTIAGVSVSFILSLIALNHIVFEGGEVFNGSVYTWMVSDGLRFECRISVPTKIMTPGGGTCPGGTPCLRHA